VFADRPPGCQFLLDFHNVCHDSSKNGVPQAGDSPRSFSKAECSLDASDTPSTVDHIVLQQRLYPGAKQAVHPLLCFLSNFL
jgi:hypothetical protein